MSTTLNYSFGSITQLGNQQDFNSDAIIEFSILDGHVFVVCDGHDGDEGHGALAAKLTADSFKKYFSNRSYKDLNIALTNAVTYANYAVHEQSQKDTKYKNIGSTLAILIYRNNKVYYAYAGDSRIYMHKDNKLKPLTLDHVENKYSPAESKVNILIGPNKDIKFGVCKTPIELKENDKFLLCTDGLTDIVKNEEISTIISDSDTSPDHKALLLAKKADENGGVDNTSIHIIEFDNNHPVPKKSFTLNKNFILIAIAIFTVTILGFGGFKGYQYFINNKSEKPTKIAEQKLQTNSKPVAEVIENKKSITVEKEKIIQEQNTPKTQAKPREEQVKTTAKIASSQAVFYTHKILFGENLYRLAIRYGTTQRKLIEINGDNAKNLIAGSKLKIPVLALHTVKKGESFSIISDKYNIKIDVICRANKISKTQSLAEGKKLIIPKK